MAEDNDVDLVEVAPNAQPPVCRLMDYGKFRYQEQKKAALFRKYERHSSSAQSYKAQEKGIRT